MGTGLVFSSDHLEADEALAEFRAALEGELLRDPFLIRFRAGPPAARPGSATAWASGSPEGFVEPLESTAIHLIMIAVTRLLQLFPFGPDHAAQRAPVQRARAERGRARARLHRAALSPDRARRHELLAPCPRDGYPRHAARTRSRVSRKTRRRGRPPTKCSASTAGSRSCSASVSSRKAWNRVGALMTDERLKQSLAGGRRARGCIGGPDADAPSLRRRLLRAASATNRDIRRKTAQIRA